MLHLKTIKMWTLILLYLGLALVYAGRGVEQGILWSKKGADAFTWNEHLVLAIVRILIVAVVVFGGIVGDVHGWWQVLMIGVTLVPGFWFYHNTAYYLTRNTIDPTVYPNWFTAESGTSTSKFNAPFMFRIIGFGVSIVLLILYTTLAI